MHHTEKQIEVLAKLKEMDGQRVSFYDAKNKLLPQSIMTQ